MAPVVDTMKKLYFVAGEMSGDTHGAAVMAALSRNRIVALLADRDIGGNGVTVNLFGRPSEIPSGPALMALRTGLAILPTAVYFRDHDRICRIGEPLVGVRDGRLREDVMVLSRRLGVALTELIAAAPEQWHVLEPLWNDDQAMASDRNSTA